MTGVQLFVPTLAHIRVDSPAPADPYRIALWPIDRLLRFGSPELAGRRMRVSGSVTLVRGNRVYLSDGTGALEVRTVRAARRAASATSSRPSASPPPAPATA